MLKAPTQKELYKGMVAYFKGEETSFTAEDFIDFCNGRIAVIDKKAANKKATKTQEDNIILANKIVDVLATFENPVTATQLLARLKADGVVDEMTSLPKITSRLHALKEDGRVIRTTDKKTAFFAIA